MNLTRPHQTQGNRLCQPAPRENREPFLAPPVPSPVPRAAAAGQAQNSATDIPAGRRVRDDGAGPFHTSTGHIDMTDRLAKLLAEEPDLHGLMLAVCRAWVEKYHPDAKWTCLVVEQQEGMPAIRITFPGASVASPPPDAPPLPRFV